MKSKKTNKGKQAVTGEYQAQEQEITNKETSANEQSAENKPDENAQSEKDNRDLQIEELNAKLLEFSDKHLRLQAEFDNYRKRTMKEKADLIKAGGESVLISILPVIDDFERALNLLKDLPDDDAGKIGTQLIYNKFADFLKVNNIKEIEAINQPFDVDMHEAITKIPAPSEEMKGKVVDVVQKGYYLNEKVIRFAKVVIGE